jgi:DNA-binding HxlR family transcriptional regulator
MGSREYGQPCGIACALDQVGERWSLLIVRELMLGPLRFSDLDRAVGGAPTDVLTKRLRDLEDSGVVRRRKLEPPTSATAYELTPLGRELERPLLELGRWGLNFHDPATIVEMSAAMLAKALRLILRPDRSETLTVGLRSGEESYRLRIEDGWIAARRGEAESSDLTLSGTPLQVMASLIGEDDPDLSAEISGDREALAALRAMVVLPDAHRAAAEVELATGVAAAT